MCDIFHIRSVLIPSGFIEARSHFADHVDFNSLETFAVRL